MLYAGVAALLMANAAWDLLSFACILGRFEPVARLHTGMWVEPTDSAMGQESLAWWLLTLGYMRGLGSLHPILLPLATSSYVFEALFAANGLLAQSLRPGAGCFVLLSCIFLAGLTVAAYP